MIGTILFINEGAGTAFLRADDGKRYRFALSDWPEGITLSSGMQIDFEPDGELASDPVPIGPVTAAPAPVASAAAPPSTTLSPAAAAPEAEGAIGEGPMLAPAQPTGSDESAPTGGHPFTRQQQFESRPEAPLATARSSGNANVRNILIMGGILTALVVAALAYMMLDNAPSAELSSPPPVAAPAAAETITMYATDDLSVRNAASMANSTILGRIARGERVSGVIVPGTSDPSTQWLQLAGGNRFVPLTGLTAEAPAVLPTDTTTALPDGGEGDFLPDGVDLGGGADVNSLPDVETEPGVEPVPPPSRPAPGAQRPPAPRPAPRPAPSYQDTPAVDDNAPARDSGPRYQDTPAVP